MLYHEYGQKLRRYDVAGVNECVVAILDLASLVDPKVVYEPAVKNGLAGDRGEAHDIQHRQNNVLPEEDPHDGSRQTRLGVTGPGLLTLAGQLLLQGFTLVQLLVPLSVKKTSGIIDPALLLPGYF